MDRAHPERLKKTDGVFVFRLIEKPLQDDKHHEKGDDAKIGGHHRTRRRRQREERCRQHQQGRHSHQEISVEIILRPKRSELDLIHPRHERAQKRSERHAGEDDHAGDEGAGEPAEKIVELPHRRGANDLAEAGLVVAHDDVCDKSRGGEDREDAHYDQCLDDRVRRVVERVAARPDMDVRVRDCGEGQQEENAKSDPEHGRGELIAQLERGDLLEHLRRPGGFCGAK